MIPGGQRRHEAPDLGGMMRRMIRSLVRRAGEGDTEALEQLCALEAEIRTATSLAGRQLHTLAGYSYTELGDVMGVTRQAARQRFEGMAGDPEVVAYYLR